MGRQAENAAATREALLEAARRLFTDKGYAGAGTEEIVRAARVTRGALYHHFQDKRDLFRAVWEAEQARLAAEVASKAAGARDPWTALKTRCRAFLEICREPAVRQIVLIDGPAVLGFEGIELADQRWRLAGTLQAIEAAIQAGLIQLQPVEPLAHLILGGLNHAGMLIAHADDSGALARDTARALDNLLDGLRRR